MAVKLLMVEETTETDMSRKLKPVSPGETLAEEFLKSPGMGNYRLVKKVGVPTWIADYGSN